MSQNRWNKCFHCGYLSTETDMCPRCGTAYSDGNNLVHYANIVRYSLDTFKRCQLCGYSSDDIAEFRMWTECDDNGHPQDNHTIVVCRQKKCRKVLDEQSQLYVQVPWGSGSPGNLILLCGDCAYRDDLRCTHSSLTDNGGAGLEIRFSHPLGENTQIYTGHNSDTISLVATQCKGWRDNT